MKKEQVGRNIISLLWKSVFFVIIEKEHTGVQLIKKTKGRQMEKVINVDKEILGGTPVFMGTRVPIKNLFDYLEEGETTATFLEDFPSVKKEQVDSVLKMAQLLLWSLTQVSHEN